MKFTFQDLLKIFKDNPIGLCYTLQCFLEGDKNLAIEKIEKDQKEILEDNMNSPVSVQTVSALGDLKNGISKLKPEEYNFIKAKIDWHVKTGNPIKRPTDIKVEE